MIDPFKKIYELYKSELEFTKILIKNYSKAQKLLLITLLTIFSVTFMWGCELEFSLQKVILFLISAVSYVSVFPFADRFTNRVFDKLEPKLSEGEKIASRYRRYITRRILELNDTEIYLTKEELVDLGHETKNLYVSESEEFQMRFPTEFLSITLSVIALLATLFKAESLADNTKMLFLIYTFCGILFIIMIWFVVKMPYELFMNSFRNRAKRIVDVLIGLKFKK